MPYAHNGSIRIHYEVEGEGAALVLQHGSSESVVDWYEASYVEALRTDLPPGERSAQRVVFGSDYEGGRVHSSEPSSARARPDRPSPF